MYLQLIRIVSGSSVGQNTFSNYKSYYNKNKKEGSSTSQYYRLFLFRDLGSVDGKVLYIVESKCMNEKLWGRFPTLRDNGVLTIGSYVGIMNPQPITQRFCNEIPILECRGGARVMMKPSSTASIGIVRGVLRNTTRAFVLNNVEVSLLNMDVVTTKCSGLFCDRQRAMEILRGNRACGCYMMQTRVGNVVLVHDVDVSKNGERIVTMEDFSSIEFSKLYLKKSSTPQSGLINLIIMIHTLVYRKLLMIL